MSAGICPIWMAVSGRSGVRAPHSKDGVTLKVKAKAHPNLLSYKIFLSRSSVRVFTAGSTLVFVANAFTCYNQASGIAGQQCVVCSMDAQPVGGVHLTLISPVHMMRRCT